MIGYESGLIARSWAATAAVAAGSTSSADDSPEVRTIKDVIENEIRPAVALDGGDVSFERFEDDVVYLQMKGACSGCPSSAMTLRDGIEVRLRNAVPSIRGVVAI
jgi:Fe-S cluster biogenesis protein NfuA